MEKRRIVFGFGVEYSTPVEKLKAIPAMIEKMFASIEHATWDRIHFKEFADSSLNFEAVYYLDSKEYNVYMDTQQDINLAIKQVFEENEISMAFPTRTIYTKKID